MRNFAAKLLTLMQKTVSAKIFMWSPVKVKPAQMQPVKGVNDGLEDSNQTTPQGEKG